MVYSLNINGEPSLGIQIVYYRERSNRYIIGQQFLLGLGGKERLKSLANTT